MTARQRSAPAGLIALLLAALLGAAGAQQDNKTNTDAGIRQALLAQRDAITNWQAFSDANAVVGWDEAVPNVCSWSGVNCTTDGTVYRLDWSCDNCLHCPLIREWDFNLCAQPHAQGRLAPELANITSLRQVFIKGQNISGPLPGEWAAVGAFPELRDLAIENNSFTGTLPASWGRAGAFPNVWRIWLNDNELIGTLPPEWGGEGALKNLTWLKLHNNGLEGSIPQEWGQNTSFVRLTNSTSNEGVCPTGVLGQFQKCEITLINNTALCGPVPQNLVPVVCAEDKGSDRSDQQATCVAQPDGTLLLSNKTCGGGPAPAASPAASPAVSPAASPAASPPTRGDPSPSPEQASPPPPASPDQNSTAGTAGGPVPPPESSSSGSSTNTGAIVGGVIGGLVVLGGATFAFVKLRGHKSLQGWKKEPLDGHGLPVHHPGAAAGGGSTAGGAVYQPARLPAAEPGLPGFDGVQATARQ